MSLSSGESSLPPLISDGADFIIHSSGDKFPFVCNMPVSVPSITFDKSSLASDDDMLRACFNIPYERKILSSVAVF